MASKESDRIGAVEENDSCVLTDNGSEYLSYFRLLNRFCVTVVNFPLFGRSEYSPLIGLAESLNAETLGNSRRKPHGSLAQIRQWSGLGNT